MQSLDTATYGVNQEEPHPEDCNISGAGASAISDTDSPSKMPIKNNALYCGDNLVILRDRIADESVDLIYLDPPFNSKRDYNLIFRERSGKKATSQELVFGDTWEWSENADQACRELVESGGSIAEVIRAFRSFLGTSDMMAYIAMMAPRLVELRRVLKVTGSIYLHCDPTASHYLKILMDAIFGGENFRNEIIWKRSTTKNDYVQGATNWPRVHDVILTYARDSCLVEFTQPFTPLSQSYIDSHYKLMDENGRKYQLDNLTAPGAGMRGHPQYEFMGVTRFWRYNKEKMERLATEGRVVQPRPGAVPRYKRFLDEAKGVAIADIWTDVYPVNSQAQERRGYPTQKPEALLRRIIEASSSRGDVVLDPFCGCGTAVEVAQELERRWVGIDITYLSLAIIKQRLVNSFGRDVFKNINVIGEPVTEDEALALAATDKFGFQCWAVGRLGAPPIEHKKGADRGIDGRIYFHDDFGAPKHIIVSVKAGDHIGPAFVRELRGVVDREKAEMGILVCVKEPTSEMKKEAAQLGWYKGLGGNFPRMQIITLKDIFANKPLNVPVKRINPYERKGPQSVRPVAEQLRLLP